MFLSYIINKIQIKLLFRKDIREHNRLHFPIQLSNQKF